jgi:hypothetical protein
MNILYTPKGSMCMACVHRQRDCSGLDFAKMQAMDKMRSGQVIVSCNEFENKGINTNKSVLGFIPTK